MQVSLQGRIESNFDGYGKLIALDAQFDDVLFEEIRVDFSKVSWIDANMAAPLGAILYKASMSFNDVLPTGIPKGIEEILSKNGFLATYGWTLRHDTHGTTIPYKRFKPEDERYFGTYIDQGLVGKGIPEMSVALRKKFLESIFEVFSNAVHHSGTMLGIHACGQFFPKKKRLDFSLSDLGIGFSESIRLSRRIELADEQAIEWALSERNTSRSGPVPGGMGLKLLKEFVEKNEGRIQIVSLKGYWELSPSGEHLKSFDKPFPGTIVNLEFKTSDTKSYRLASEIKSDDIF